MGVRGVMRRDSRAWGRVRQARIAKWPLKPRVDVDENLPKRKKPKRKEPKTRSEVQAKR